MAERMEEYKGVLAFGVDKGHPSSTGRLAVPGDNGLDRPASQS